MNLKNCLLLLLLAGVSACNKTGDLPGFNETEWQADENGCQGIRLKMLDDFKQVKDQLKGLNEDEIVDVLGMPDKNELYKRNQKFFIYEITNAPQCLKKKSGDTRMFLSIRFNATKLAKEVMIYREMAHR